MKKIAEIHPAGVPAMIVYYDGQAKTNPYRVYQEWFEYIPDAGCRKRTKQVDRYSDLYSCAWEMAKYTHQHNEEGR